MPKLSTPAFNLQRAAHEYSWAMRDKLYTMAGAKFEGYTDREARLAWDRLRKAAIRYRDSERPTGRPRST